MQARPISGSSFSTILKATSHIRPSREVNCLLLERRNLGSLFFV